MEKIKVLFLAAELNPLAKVGGLADVIGALPKSLIKREIDVRIMIPCYGIIDKEKYGLKTSDQPIKVFFNGQDEEVQIYQTYLPGSQAIVYLIENKNYLSEGGVYFEKDASSGGTPKECQRFSFFTKLSLEILPHLVWWPDIIHHHDWHVGLLPVFLKMKAKQDKRYKNIKSILNIHNLAYQGKYNHVETLKLLDLNEKAFPTLGIKFGENRDINFLQQSILNTDLIITVSPNYAKEILTEEYGECLNKDLGERKNFIYGILNGIDTERFNPANDTSIVKNYSAKNIENKKANKLYLQKVVGLEENPEIPLFGFIGRLSEQKGIDLVGQIIDDLAKKSIQLVVLGAGLDPFEKIAQSMVEKYPKNVFVKIAFDAKLAQQIYAGADFFLMPSRFEPCGLGQMISMRYGTIPIARATGGLKDSILEFNLKTREGTGFLFYEYKPTKFLKAIDKALNVFKKPDVWPQIIKNAMQQDFSWEKSSKKYIELYKKVLNSK
jgi:starch synthase